MSSSLPSDRNSRGLRLGSAMGAVFVVLPVLQACVAPPPERRQPVIVERPHPSMQRLIVQYGEGDPRAHERRIFAALQGVPHTVANSVPNGRVIIVETDRRGLRRLQALPGVTVSLDGFDAPSGIAAPEVRSAN